MKAKELAENPYQSKQMTDYGKKQFPEIMIKAIKTGNELSLESDLNENHFGLQMLQ
ncbi:MAG: hypothetical protein J4F36_12925 [Nitrosopumilaceae archaeon]|nr:hypothetical protein [Nitrosopumilaceae archaeon]